MPVTFINALNVDPKDDAFFVEMWDDGARYIAKQPGFIATSLRKSHSQAAAFQYFTVAVWESDEQFIAATSTDWWNAFRKRFGFMVTCRGSKRHLPSAPSCATSRGCLVDLACLSRARTCDSTGAAWPLGHVQYVVAGE